MRVNTTLTRHYKRNTSMECEQCGCIGNMSCGHEWLDKKNWCTLDSLGVCPCCNIDKDHMINAINPDETQESLALCEWSLDEYDYHWNTSCGEEFILNEGTPFQNGMRFCHHCGKRIKKKK